MITLAVYVVAASVIVLLALLAFAALCAIAGSLVSTLAPVTPKVKTIPWYDRPIFPNRSIDK